jgi:hypothetical protein
MDRQHASPKMAGPWTVAFRALLGSMYSYRLRELIRPFGLLSERLPSLIHQNALVSSSRDHRLYLFAVTHPPALYPKLDTTSSARVPCTPHFIFSPGSTGASSRKWIKIRDCSLWDFISRNSIALSYVQPVSMPLNLVASRCQSTWEKNHSVESGARRGLDAFV